MESFCQVLLRVRLENGYKTAKSFFNYLKTRGLDCNYQYFIKIEKGLVFPSSVLINQMAKALERTSAELIVSAFCSHQFESFQYLFSLPVSGPQGSSKTNSAKEKINITVEQGQKELNYLQVNTLKKRKENYFLFLLITLSRKDISVNELKKYPKLIKSIKDLTNANIINFSNNSLHATSSEFKFPKDNDMAIVEAYRMFDLWDIEFGEQFEFKNYLNKMMIRRISPRYFGVIQKQIDAFTDFVRCSDESDQRFNNEVLHLHIKISKGELPG